MSKYELTWITEHLAAGHAPFSHDDLAEMRWHGVDAIINLCGEYCDLHEIQQDSGFEVYYLPMADESAPDTAEMEKAIEWVDEMIDQGKKVNLKNYGVPLTPKAPASRDDISVKKNYGMPLPPKAIS